MEFVVEFLVEFVVKLAAEFVVELGVLLVVEFEGQVGQGGEIFRKNGNQTSKEAGSPGPNGSGAKKAGSLGPGPERASFCIRSQGRQAKASRART